VFQARIDSSKFRGVATFRASTERLACVATQRRAQWEEPITSLYARPTTATFRRALDAIGRLSGDAFRAQWHERSLSIDHSIVFHGFLPVPTVGSCILCAGASVVAVTETPPDHELLRGQIDARLRININAAELFTAAVVSRRGPKIRPASKRCSP
jgi:hypothetical protein